jgi:hypothetical protein
VKGLRVVGEGGGRGEGERGVGEEDGKGGREKGEAGALRTQTERLCFRRMGGQMARWLKVASKRVKMRKG